ncbi:MAG: ice-binding family protein [Proteobacteria bacterium]|nr:ice-binding family protein [Pseudomonadota bacterium]
MNKVWCYRKLKSYVVPLLMLIALGYGASTLAAGSPSFSATASGTTSNLTLTATLNIADADVSRNGNIYLAFNFNRQWFFNNGAGWVLFNGGIAPIYLTAPLANRTVDVVRNADMSGLVGGQLYAGYGLTENDMLVNGKFGLVYTVIGTTSLPPNPTAPLLGEAGRFVMLASQAVTTTPGSTISNGDIGIIDIPRTGIAGFTPTGPAGDFTVLSNGTSYAPNDANPAPFPYPLKYATLPIGAAWTTTGALITQVRTDLGIADTFLAADPNPGAPTQVSPIELGNLVLTRGVYRSAANISITTGALHLDAQGDSNSVFIIVTDGTLTTGASGSIVLDNLAQAKNVYWRSAGKTTIAAGTTFFGNVFAVTQVNVLAGANVTGRLFARTDRVTLIADTVTKAP